MKKKDRFLNLAGYAFGIASAFYAGTLAAALGLFPGEWAEIVAIIALSLWLVSAVIFCIALIEKL